MAPALSCLSILIAALCFFNPCTSSPILPPEERSLPAPDPDVVAPAPVWLFPKSWWSSGHSSKESPVELQSAPENKACILRWSPKVVSEYTEYYRAIQHPPALTASEHAPGANECEKVAQAGKFEELRCAAWGLTSGMRDVGTWLMKGLEEGKASLQRADVNHMCKPYCNKARGTFDTHLGCFFIPLSACRSPYENRSGPPSRIDLKDMSTMNMELATLERVSGGPHWSNWLSAGAMQWLTKEAAVESAHAASGKDVGLFAAPSKGLGEPLLDAAVKKSFVRTMLAGLAWRPLPALVQRVQSLETTFGFTNMPRGSAKWSEVHPMVVLHARRQGRTHKSTNPLVQALLDKLPDGKMPVTAYADMVQALETSVLGPGKQFKTVLVLSDDLEVWANREALFGSRRVLVNPYWTHGKQKKAQMREGDAWRRAAAAAGGSSAYALGSRDAGGLDTEMYGFHKQLLADVYFAAQHADYLIGYGSSGVSQLLAQLMGFRHRIDGAWLALWEEDFLNSPASVPALTKTLTAAATNPITNPIPNTNTNSNVGAQTSVSSSGEHHPPKVLWLFPKTWWTSGHHARQEPAQLSGVPPENEAIIFQWTEAAVEEYKEHYRKIQHPPPLSANDRAPDATECKQMVDTGAFQELRCTTTGYGLTSMMRDMGMLIIDDLQRGKASLQRTDIAHLCKKYCGKARGTLDQHAACFFTQFSACLSPYEGISGPPSFIRLNDETSVYMEKPEHSTITGPPQYASWLEQGKANWFDHKTYTERVEAAARAGGSVPALARPSRALDVKWLETSVRISFLRSMLTLLTWRPRPDITEMVTALEKEFGFATAQRGSAEWESLHPMVVLHVRRTDKANDNGIARLIRQKYPSGHLPVSFYVDMVRKIESTTLDGKQFKTVYVLSDDLEVWNNRKDFGTRNVKVNPYWVRGQMSDMLNKHEWRSRGHEQLHIEGEDKGQDDVMFTFHAQLIADVLFAAKHADYLVGCGSSGISQFIAQLMGQRYRMDGTWFALWEEDFARMQ